MIPEINHLNPDVQRLRKDWEMHGKIILAIDYYDVIHPWNRKNEELKSIIQTIINAQTVGTYNVIFTSYGIDHDEIRNYCNSVGINVDAINQSPISLPIGSENKIYYNHLLDSRAGLPYALEVLNTCIVLQRSHKRSLIHLDEIA